jgi:prepilin-type N-terminal cleavage/methylation domain-containing protein
MVPILRAMGPRSLTRALKRSAAPLSARLRDERGFTLIELMTTMILMGFGLIAAFGFYSSAVGRTADSEARINSVSELRITGERMARDVRESASICSPAPAPTSNSLYLSGPTDLADLGGASDCEASRMIVWTCEGGGCFRSEGGGSPVLQVEGLSTSLPVFTSSGGDYVSIYLAKVPEDRTGAITFERAATLRNYCEDGC